MDIHHLARRASAITILITAACGGSSDAGSTPPPPPPPADVASVTVSPSSVALAAGATQQLTAAALDARGAALTSPAPVWTTSDGNTVSVSSSGLVQALAAGTATITATVTTSGATKSASAVVTVTAPIVAASITVSPSASDTIYSLGDSRAFSTTVRDASGAVLASAPVTWSVDQPGVATLSSTSGASTTASAAGNGTAVLTATSGAVSGTARLYVRQRAATLSVAPTSLALAPGGTAQLTAAAKDARGNAVGGLAAPSYVSSDTTKVRVSPSGLVSAVAAGTATVSVAESSPDGPLSASVAVTVASQSFPTSASVTVEDYDFAPDSVDILAGGTVTWTWKGAQPHSVTAATGGSGLGSQTQTSGTYSFKFSTPGKYDYFCSVHTYMTATVVVH
ncbi:MAG TPA: Ig-like domain-containing protein [Gemmatimonadaceae bacterium]|nr:Ig-like domain-containing protein [Gemmatimonadaceae bacterium]